MKLDGKVAIVTGAARGIGHAIAERFLRDGAKVMLADAEQAAGDAAERDLAPLGTVQFHRTDVGKRLDAHNLVAATLNAFGDIDMLVNAAGAIHAGGFLDLTEEDFDRVLRINLKGSFLVGQAVARHMVEKVAQGGAPGSIVNLSSISAVVATPDALAFAVSMGGVNQLTRAMALSLAPHRIRVNAIGPGAFETDRSQGAMDGPAESAAVLSRIPLGRIGKPQELASIAAFLASEEASYIDGQVIYADGGRLPLY